MSETMTCSHMADTLCQLRKGRNCTQQQLADAIGVCRSAIANWETGQQIPSTRSLIALADFFGCSLNDLTGSVKMPSKADALHDTRNFLSSTDEASEGEGR